MYANMRSWLPLLLVSPVSASVWPTLSFKTSALTPPQFQVTKSGAALGSGLVFVTPQSVTGRGAYIYTDAGQLVWGVTGNSFFSNLNVQTYNGSSVLTYWSGQIFPDTQGLEHGYGQLNILDTTYKTIHTICPQGLKLVYPPGIPASSCPLDFHDGEISSRGTILGTAYNLTQADLTSVGGPANGWVWDSLFYDIDIATGAIVFSWSALAHIDIKTTKTPIAPGDHTTGTSPSTALEWFHINTIQPGFDGYLLNGRNTWSTYLLGLDGTVEFFINGQNGGDFTLGPGISFSWQYHARLSSPTATNGIMSWLNNENSLPPLNGTAQTTALALFVDWSTFTATLLDNFVDPNQEIFSDTQGSNSFLSNGNSFVGYGQVPIIKEFGSGGDTRMTIQFGNENDGTTESYRAYRAAWSATPATTPTVVIKSGTLYVSWNGATNVTSWVISASTSSNSKLVKVSQVNKVNFETSYQLSSSYKYVQVTAYSGTTSISNSAVVKV